VHAWVMRAGRGGERDDWMLANGYAGGGFKEVADLSAATTREAVTEAIEAGYPGKPKAFVANFTGQLWALRQRAEHGDLVVLPLKTTGQLALGHISGAYTYRDDPDPDLRHVRPVEWKRSDVPRTAVGQDLLFTLNGAATIFGCTRNDAVYRLRTLAETGHDPGARSTVVSPSAEDDGEDPVTSAASFDLERVARDAITQSVIARFAGHRLARLTGEILTAQGFTCSVSPPGPDRGVDVYAGRGALGLDSPRLVVQVKSDASPVGAPVVQQLQGALSTAGADQALLVAWGGLTKQAQQAVAGQQFKIRVWTADELIDALCATYSQLSEELRAELPLKQVWTVVDEGVPIDGTTE
jgi:restriction system protein